MISPDVIEQQCSHLAAHRDALGVQLRRQAILGVVNTPPDVALHIRDARSEIKRIKSFLRQHNVVVEDHPDDEESPTTPLDVLSAPLQPFTPQCVDQRDEHNFQALARLIARRRKIAFICGSELNTLANLPSWEKLSDLVIEALRDDTAGAKDQQRHERFLKDLDKTPNCWLRFEKIKERAPQLLRTVFGSAGVSNVPGVYDDLWRFDQTVGIIDLSLAKFTHRAFSNVRQEKPVQQFATWRIRNHPLAFEARMPFIYHPHGVDTNIDDLAITIERIRSLTDQREFITFFQNLFDQTTVVLCGVSAAEIEQHSLLFHIRRNVSFRNHFWIKDRSNPLTDQWANETGVQTIRYGNPNGPHSGLLEILRFLHSYREVDKPHITPIAPPSLPQSLVGSVSLSEKIPPDVLAAYDPEDIRLILHQYAKEIFEGDTQGLTARYTAFQNTYSRAIHNAWYIERNRPDYVFFGYRIKKYFIEGGYGKIYQAVDQHDNPVAIKLLKQEVSEKEHLLDNFRRGVSAMSILSQRNVTGMVEYLQAFEIPACVVMPWIEGRNLREAVNPKSGDKRKPLHDWSEILKFAEQLSGIILRAHDVVEQVLHRDLRPENIMLQEDWSEGEEDWKVVVLDFDLAWFVGSRLSGEAKTRNETTTHYLAPEQVDEREGVTTRDPLVDSYGFGMTLFFTLDGKDPQPLMHKWPSWQKMVLDATLRITPRSRWVSLPRRIARLIIQATQDTQRERVDMAGIHAELQRLREAHRSPSAVKDLELIVEELINRSSYCHEYSWNEIWKQVQVELPSGSTLHLMTNEREKSLKLSIKKLRSSHVPFGTAANEHRRINDRIKAAFEEVGWIVDRTSANNQQLSLDATLPADVICVNLDKAAEVLDGALALLSR